MKTEVIFYGGFLYVRCDGKAWNNGIAFLDDRGNNRMPESWRPGRDDYSL